jgi:glutathione S-transferase
VEEKGGQYELREVASGTTRTAQHLLLHAFGRIPVLDHGEFRVYEAQAILRYIDTVRDGQSLRPSDPRQAAQMDQIVGIVDWYVFPQVSIRISAERLFAQRFWNRPTDEATIEKALPDARACINELARLQGSAPFMAGENVSIADLMLAPHIDYFSKTPEGEMLLRNTSLASWIERMRSRSSMRATDPDRLTRAA